MFKLTWNYHCHTKYTDGFHTVEEIARRCDELGMEEIAVTEHVSRQLTYSFDQLLSDINQANDRFHVRIIPGIEAKILPDGTLDCTDEIRKEADIVIGSVHGLGGMTRREAHEKLAEADCMIIGHPQFFNEKMIDSLVRTGKIIELSNRYDQPDEMIKAFRDAGLLFSIGLDSHRLEDLGDDGRMAELLDKFELYERLWRFPLQDHSGSESHK